MNTNFQKIRKLLLNSGLSSQEQEDLVVLFARTSDEDLETAVILFSEDINWAKMISANYQTKQKAIANKNAAAWNRIIQDEHDKLSQI